MIAAWLLLLSTAGLAANGTPLVYPSGVTIPVNCLRLSIRFAEAQQKPVLPRLQLRDSRGEAVTRPFLEEELWSPDRRTLTILFHPGRLKDGVGPHDRLGPPLAGLKRATLTLDSAPLKTWIVASPCGPVDTHGWTIDEPPVAGSHSAVRLRLDRPIDMQAEHLIAIVDSSGQRSLGEEKLIGNESLWQFIPAQAWHPGEYRIVIHQDLEDACGDRMREAFEQVADKGTSSPRGAPYLTFVIRTGLNELR